MTYSANEISTQDGTPFECYVFNTPQGDFRYTTLPFAVTLASQEFTPETIDRTGFSLSALIDGIKTMDIMLPVGNALVDVYKAQAVPAYCSLTVYRAHYGDDLNVEYTTEWKGEVIGTGIQGDIFVFKTQSQLLSLLAGRARSVFYQYGCNNRVYDGRCQILEASFLTTGTVIDVDQTEVIIDDDGVADSELVLGKIKCVRTSEIRNIINNTERVSLDTRIDIGYPFDDLIVGDTVQLILGCDNRLTTCVNRFNNLQHFNGFPYIPKKNPFEGL